MMTIEDLKTVAAQLYKGAEEAIPIVGDAEKKEWMANRLNDFIEDKDPTLNCLVAFNTTSEVLEFLEKQYENRKEETAEELPCASAAINDYTRMTDRSDKVTATDAVQDSTIIIEEKIIIIEDADDRTGGDVC